MKELFFEAQSLSGEARTAFLLSSCAGDSDLLDEVQSLLSHSEGPSPFETQRPGAPELEYHADWSTMAPRTKAAWPGEKTLEPGTPVGEYVVEAQLGSGAFGTVYRGVHPVIGKRVAIKVLSLRYSADPAVVSRFVAEARAVNKIGHSGIIDIFAFGELSDGRRYHVMELVDGGTLADLMKEKGGRFELDETIAILEPIARALDAAGAAGIAHRDLKPLNILLGRAEDGALRPKLLDFGVAKLIDEEDPQAHRTDTGVALGTPSYMAPEQVTGRAIDHRADIYAFGVLVFQMLSGRLPFRGRNAFMIMAKHVDDPPPLLHELDDTISKGVSRVVARMLAKNPEDRPQTLMEVMEALRTLQGAPAGGQEDQDDLDDRAHDTISQRPFEPTPPPTIDLDLPPSSDVVAASGDVESPQPEPLDGSRRRWPWLAVTMAVAAGLVSVVITSRVRPRTPTIERDAAAAVTPRAPGTHANAAPPPAVVAPVQKSVRIEVRGVPADAQIRDAAGALLSRGPGVVELTHSSETITLSVEAESFEPRTVELVADRDQVLVVDLDPVRAVSPRPAKARPAVQDRPRPNDIEPWE